MTSYIDRASTYFIKGLVETAKQRMNKRLLDGLGGEDQERQVGQVGGEKVFQRAQVQEGYQTTRMKQNLEQLHFPF